MEIRASVQNHEGTHHVTVQTDGRTSILAVPSKADGLGSSINGGELLCLALATCYCNDLYREAAKRGLTLRAIEVDVVSEFGAAGEPARRIRYAARVESDVPADEIAALLRHTDTVAEVHNTLRSGIAVELAEAADLDHACSAESGTIPESATLQTRPASNV